MRLLDTRNYQTKEELGTVTTPYAILSHTWEEEEISFQDIQSASDIDWKAKKGFIKVQHACKKALRDGYNYIWIDTCCINKDSSAELSEAINRMFRWYQDAHLCYAFLSDAHYGDESSFASSRWFTRGWTLQEMIAPNHVHFYDQTWSYIGSRISLAALITKVTGVNRYILTRGHMERQSANDRHVSKVLRPGTNLCSYCRRTEMIDVQSALRTVTIAQRMKWASRRQTTRQEDIAYSLLGLFDVNMPLMYGESGKAFIRLQEAILRQSRDHSILAFRSTSSRSTTGNPYASILAPDPAHFQDDISDEWSPSTESPSISFVDGQLTTEMYLCALRPGPMCLEMFTNKYIGILDCTMGNDYLARPAILLDAVDTTARLFRRCPTAPVLLRVDANHGTIDQSLPYCTLLDSYGDQVQFDPKDMVKSRITITPHHNNDRILHPIQALPIKLQYRLNNSKFTRNLTYPPIVANYQSGIPLGTVGIVSFASPTTQPLFIVWGPYLDVGVNKIWCKIFNLKEVWGKFWRLSKSQREVTVGEEGIAEVVDYVQHRRENLWLVQPPNFPKREWDTCLVDTSQDVEVWVSVERVTFINRSVFQMSIHFEPCPED